MRGLPPLQALLLLIVLAVLSFAGSHYIGMNEAQSQPRPLPNASAEGHTVEAEIEFIFSSPPVSFTLTQPLLPEVKIRYFFKHLTRKKTQVTKPSN